VCVCASSQGGCFQQQPQDFPTQQSTAAPGSMDPKLHAYPSQFTAAAVQAQFPPELATLVGQQDLGFGAPRGAFPGGTTGVGLRPGMPRPQGVGTQLRLPPNQLRLQLQQRVQGPQQVRTRGWGGLTPTPFYCVITTSFRLGWRTLLLVLLRQHLFFNVHTCAMRRMSREV